jgi:hypothetical protein
VAASGVEFNELTFNSVCAFCSESGIERIKLFLESTPGATHTEILDQLRVVATFSALPVEDRLFLFVGGAFNADCAKANAIVRYKVTTGADLCMWCGVS